MDYHKILMDSRRFIKIPTIHPFKQYDPLKDAEQIRSALIVKGSESELIQLLTKRSNAQRQEIISCYRKKYCKDPVEEVQECFNSKFRKVVVGLLTPPFDYLACEIEHTITAMMTDDELITEILCTRSNEKIKNIVTVYQRIFGKALEDSIDSQHDLSSQYKKLIRVLICCPRDEAKRSDDEKAKEMATSIHNAVEAEDKEELSKLLIRILTHESYDQLCLIFDEYRQVSGCTIHETIKASFSGDVEYAFLAIVKSAICKHQFYAERIECALKKSLRRDDHTLIRIFVSRAEIDLEEIKREYMRNYFKTLYNAIRSELSGPYQEVMLALLNTP